MRRKLSAAVALAVAGVVAMVALPSAFGHAQVDPGITARTITIGGTFPLTGYAPIPVGMKAYFSYVNATKGPDGKRGVGGRQIIFKYYDDAYNPAQTVQLTQQLVQQDHVFATVGALGTPQQEAVRQTLNSEGVPQLYVSTGATEY